VPPQIVGLRGSQASQSFVLGDAPLTFGRSPENAIVLDTPRASRRHAEIRREGSDYILADLGSANGTIVNGQRLSAPHRLRPGDTFEIGDDTFRFDAPQPAMDATLIATPAPVASPPTVPVGPQSPPPYQPPATPPYQPPMPPPPQQSQGGYVGSLPNTPPQAGGAPPKRGGISRNLLIVLGLVGFVFAIACIGGAVVLTRGLPLGGGTNPTAAPARRTPEPTEEGVASAPTSENGDTPVATREPVAGGADWTVLVYLDGDNNLEADAVGDFNEMEMVGSTDKVKIVVQLDRIKQEGGDDDTSSGDWDTTKRFLVERDDDEGEITSPELEDLGELNMGDPQTLADFIAWGVEEYPAQRYALVIWDHGSSWAGIAFDDTDNQDGINMPELDAALRTGGQRFDLIGFDACLMAQIDVFQTVAPHGDVAVASAELEPNEGWAWDILLQQLNDDSTQDAAAFGRVIVESYQAFYDESDDETVTLSAFDLTQVGDLRDGLNSLSEAMIADIDGSYQAIAEARSFVDAYSQPKPEEFNAVDLGHFARLVGERGASADVAEPADALVQLIDNARIAEWNNGFHSNSTGLSVFFPQISELYPDIYADASPVPQETSWDDFLDTFYQAGTSQVSAPEITGLQLSDTTVGFGNPATLEGTVAGKDIAHVFFFVGIPNGDRTGVELTYIDFIYPPGSSPNDNVPSWDDGTNDIRQSWEASRWALSNGSETIPVLLGPVKYGTDLYGIEGVYTSQVTGEETTAGLIFQVAQGRATLQQIWGFPKGKQETQPFELSPEPGDTFTALLRTYTDDGSQLVPDFIRGDTITFGNDPLVVLQAPAESGEYVAGFMVRDISGRFNYQYEDITVDNSGAGQVNPVEPAQPTPGAGSQAGTLAFSSPDMHFSLEYPDTWETHDTGNSKVYFYDPASNGESFVSVDVYTLEQSADEANQALLDAYTEALSNEQDFQQGDAQTVTIAGLEGPSFTYAYTDDEGVTRTGLALAVTSQNTGLSYLVIVQAVDTEFGNQSETFTAILNSMQIE
jgi:hypothetical protein